MVLFLNALIAGIGIGAVYAFIALGYSVVHRSTGIINIAQGDLMVAGVLVAYFCLVKWHRNMALVPLAILVVVIILSLVEERIAVRPFITGRARSTGWFVSTLGFSFALQNVCVNVYGQHPVVAIPGLFRTASIKLGDTSISTKFLAAFVAVLLTAAVLELFYQRTWLGMAMQGLAEDREIAALRGVNPAQLSQIAFAIAGVVAALAAFVVAPIISSDISVGTFYGLKGFIALAVGGFGSIRGCLVGGFLLGLSEQMFDLYISSEFEIVAGLIIVLLVLTIRPSGLFGARTVRTV